MSKIRRIFKGGEDGFTLIELLVVIAVLGILAAIAIPRIGGVRDKADIASAKSDMKNLQTGIEMYYAENGSYPSDDSWTELDEFVDNIDKTDYNFTITTSGGYPEITGPKFTISGAATTLKLTPGGFNF
ncbi:type IV pilin protein [Halanaerobium congolense]|uniref:General secretion pathway protein G n=1 Tax=Halanaerobium congolense TaxID=54121 RepID=A0A4R7EGU9_9FIRM|nr:prepilin-type N-terminal cleavage/methylation domain-containing protein [Halanaerobium congolense]TDS31741.1 general secretion pathway protein G [Halanaerobium congolense]